MVVNTSDVLHVITAIALSAAILFGNGLTIVAVARFHHLQTITNKLLVSLAVSDIMAGLLMPLYGAFFLAPWLSTMKWICLFRICFLLLSLTASIASLLSTAFIYWNEWDNISQSAKCDFIALTPSGFVYLCNLVESPVIGLVIISLYALIFKEAKRHQRKIRSEIPQIAHGVSRKKDYRTTKTLLIVLGLFFICWAPYSIMFQIDYFYRNIYNREAEHIIFYLGVLNSCMNPFVYGWRNRNFRRAYQILLHRKPRTL